jgi:hypothetical protein
MLCLCSYGDATDLDARWRGSENKRGYKYFASRNGSERSKRTAIWEMLKADVSPFGHILVFHGL